MVLAALLFRFFEFTRRRSAALSPLTFSTSSFGAGWGHQWTNYFGQFVVRCVTHTFPPHPLTVPCFLSVPFIKFVQHWAPGVTSNWVMRIDKIDWRPKRVDLICFESTRRSTVLIITIITLILRRFRVIMEFTLISFLFFVNGAHFPPSFSRMVSEWSTCVGAIETVDLYFSHLFFYFHFDPLCPSTSSGR